MPMFLKLNEWLFCRVESRFDVWEAKGTFFAFLLESSCSCRLRNGITLKQQ